PAARRAASAADEFGALLREAETQSPTQARDAAILRTVRELVPDEARILRRLADGAEDAVLQAYDGSDHILVNRSNVGRNAKVHSQDLTPNYVTHLLELGLVELMPYEDKDLYEYELLESETSARDILSHYDHRKLTKPKMVRQLLRLSDAGRKFCDVCMPE
ncbi:MAG: Abi-alpha family protein, partial [Acidimicrobiales bacterium]